MQNDNKQASSALSFWVHNPSVWMVGNPSFTGLWKVCPLPAPVPQPKLFLPSLGLLVLLELPSRKGSRNTHP
jgi:hypothetical protein